MNLDDFYIQRKIKGGDIKAFEGLFTKYYGPLCHHAFRFLKDMDTAEDIVQEFFFNFWKNRESLVSKLSLSAYLFHSIRNNSLHYLEHQSIQQQYAETVISDVQSMMPDTEQVDVNLRELNKIINETLKLMPERCSRVFCLNRFEGKKYREIAEMLSISIKTVEADMGKALQIFRKSLKDYIHLAS